MTTTPTPFTMRGVVNFQKFRRAIHSDEKQSLTLMGDRETLKEIDENQYLGNLLTYLKGLQN